MVTQSLIFIGEFQEFATERVKSGRYASEDEVLRASMKALRNQEVADDAKMAFLIKAIADGEASGIAEGDVFARVRERAGLPPRVRA